MTITSTTNLRLRPHFGFYSYLSVCLSVCLSVYVVIRECMSHLGYAGERQTVSLGDDCASTGGALHELGHTIGLYHEHSRPDRDNYIVVLLENLRRPDNRKHFFTVPRILFNSVPDVGYDIESIMHYGPFAFAREIDGYTLRTVAIREDADLNVLQCTNHLPMGQRKQLSSKDKLRLNKLYQCSESTKSI